MRRRGAAEGLRGELAARFRELEVAFGRHGQGWYSAFADCIDAGETVEVHGFEVDMPRVNRVRVLPDGTVIPVG